MAIDRARDRKQVQTALERAPVVLLTGPRQSGKSTLAREIQPNGEFRFDLEDPRDVARLGEPTLSLPDLDGLVVIDEAQRSPDLFPSLRVLVDEDRRPGRFLVLGSASPDLVGLSAESLAGRVTMRELMGFRLEDVDDLEAPASGPIDRLWLRGGLPESFLAPNDASSLAWRDDYISTFLERDLAGLGFGFPASTMRRFWTMLAHYNGQTWNGSELAAALGVSQPMTRRYLDALTDALVVQQLTPWFANVKKRQVKSPKIYIRDAGLVHALLNIADQPALLGHPKSGATWEGMIIEALVRQLGARDPSFWGTHGGAELDLRIEHERQVLGFEIKRTDRPSTTKSMRIAIEDLELDHLYVVHAGRHRFALDGHITALPAADALRGKLD